MKYIPLVVLFLLSVTTLASTQNRDVISMPGPSDVSEITIVDDTPRYFSKESLLKLLPCFTPFKGGYPETETQQGLLELKNGRKMRWVAANPESILIFTDKTKRPFRLSPGCNTVTQSKGRHGGLLKKAQNYGNLIREANFELVLEKVGSNSNLYHAVVYVTTPSGQNISVSSSGYLGILLDSKGKQIDIKLNREIAGCAADEGCFKSVETFVAASDLQVEVIVAFPGKDGTGIAIFEPFKDSSKE